jgi:phage baseplate assembly protein W
MTLFGQSALVGVSWPWKTAPQWQANADVIKTAIISVVFTALGERKKNPGFGSDTLSTVFENKGPLLNALLSRVIILAISKNLPTVTVLNIDVVEGEKDTDPVDVTVYYEYQDVKSSVTVQVATG